MDISDKISQKLNSLSLSQRRKFIRIYFYRLNLDMPLSAAEKQRRYRERRDNDPLRRAEYLEKEKRKYRAD